MVSLLRRFDPASKAPKASTILTEYDSTTIENYEGLCYISCVVVVDEKETRPVKRPLRRFDPATEASTQKN